MTAQRLSLLAALGSLLLLGGAFVFQQLGYAPCKMCIWQRWPHAAAIGIGLLILLMPARFLILSGAFAAALTAAIGAFHVGVEQKWWDGPSDCTGGGLGDLSGADLLSTDTVDRIVMCDEIAWAFMGISMPGWNAIFSALLCLIWIAAYRRAA